MRLQSIAEQQTVTQQQHAEEMAAQLSLLRQEGLSMIVSEQNLSFARSLAERAYVLESGAIRHSGTLAELDAHPERWTQYIAF